MKSSVRILLLISTLKNALIVPVSILLLGIKILLVLLIIPPPLKIVRALEIIFGALRTILIIVYEYPILKL